MEMNRIDKKILTSYQVGWLENRMFHVEAEFTLKNCIDYTPKEAADISLAGWKKVIPERQWIIARITSEWTREFNE